MENLSDDQLRVRLAQYGFANMPVTDTTRKVLIKKLKLAIDNETAKGRRETVAVTKFSSDEEPEVASARATKSQTRRATIASEKPKKVEKPAANGAQSRAETPKKTVSRRSSRASSTAIVQEDSDDDIVEINRRSRTTTPTLGKSETVRTSYKNKVTVVEESTEESANQDEDEVVETIPPPRNRSPVVQPKASAYRQSIKTSTFTVQGESMTPTYKMQSDMTPTYGRSKMSTSYNPGGNYKFDQANADSLELNESNTPYLSNFAKRLSTIRAEPLDAGLDKYRSLHESEPRSSGGYMSTRASAYKYSAPPAKAAAVSNKGESMSKFYDRLDRQYNISRAIYITLFVMIIVGIYVILM